MTAFLFDEDHADIAFDFGHQIISQILEVLQNEATPLDALISYGGLLHHNYCYDLGEIELESETSVGGNQGSRSSTQVFRADMGKFQTVVCDLVETLSNSGTSINQSELFDALGRKNVWVVVIQNVKDAVRDKIEYALSDFGPFLGWVKVDWKNPVHVDLFSKMLIDDLAILKGRISVRCEFPEGSEDRSSEENMAQSFIGLREIDFLTRQNFARAIPRKETDEGTSQRGQLSVKRARRERDVHRARIGEAIASERHGAVGDFRSFSTSRPDDGVEFVVPEAKMTQYLLNLDHEVGGAKAKFFHDYLDIACEDWRFLADQFCQQAKRSEFYRLKISQYGVGHGAIVVVQGRNGRKAALETGWKLGAKGPASLVTAYPTEVEGIEDFEVSVGRVPKPGTPAPQKWEQVHSWAHQCGLDRGNSLTPTPMVVEGYGTIWEGECGFGWARLPDARSPFAKWLIGSGLGQAARPGVEISSPLNTQSVQKHRAYAEGYAEVLKVNGLECSVHSRLD